MTGTEKILLAAAAVLGLGMLKGNSVLGGSAAALPYSGPLYIPGMSPIANPAGTVPGATPADPLSGMFEIYGTGMTAAELRAMGYTEAQIQSLSINGDPAISAILDVNPSMPVYGGSSNDYVAWATGDPLMAYY